jgi:hypothetical protein
MKTNKPGLLSGRGGSPSKGGEKPIGMKQSGGKAMSKKGGAVTKATSQPSNRGKVK